MRRAKIVATIGPASESEQALESLIKAGMNVARLNFSHGTHQEHEAKVARIRAVSKKLGIASRHFAGFAGTKDPRWKTG